MSAGKKPKVKCELLPKPQFLDVYYKEKKICDILPTSPDIKYDALEVYRPPEGKYLDYSLSQTDIKLDKELTKVHLQYTVAEYGETNPSPPKIKRKKKNIYFHGRGPCWVWLEEIWLQKQLRMQVSYKKRLKRITKKRIAYEKQVFAGGHQELIKLAGPSWFLEISPNQQKAVDGLKEAMSKAKYYRSITHVQDVIADLGLVLRPNHKHVEKAFKQSNQCPVEFLLILYQLMNPKRTNYTLNDKLLLSAVVHLTIRETLKELHVRIPSPPPNPIPPLPPRKKKPKPHYDSPYLEPFTFEPESPKHTGIYKNNHRQYPESPYFSYINQLKSERETLKKQIAQGIINPALTGAMDENVLKNSDLPPDLVAREQQIAQELASAQREYNNLAADGQAPPLLKPSIYYPCNLVSQSRQKNSKSKTKSHKRINSTKTSILSEKKSTKSGGGSKNISAASTASKPRSAKVSFHKNKTGSDLCGSISRKTASFKSKSSKSSKKSSKRTSAPPSEESDLYQTDEEPEQIPEPDLALVCDCGCFAELEKEEVRIPPYEFKVKEGIQTPSICDINIRESQLIRPEETDSDTCKCHQGVLKEVDEIFCPCDRCKKDREAWLSWKSTKVIAGTKRETFADEGVQVIESVKEFQGCSCLRNYQHAIQKFQDLRARLKAQIRLMSLRKPFVVSGVSIGPDGKPVYQLSGVVTAPCQCQEVMKLLEEEERRISNIPRLPADGRQYQITGVHQTPVGTVYSIGGTLHSKDCLCLELFREFSERHETCLSVYAEYLEKMKKDFCFYLKELQEDNESRTDGKWGPTPFEIREEEERIKNLPELPCDGKTYQITGVRGTMKGGKLTYEISGIKDAPENVCSICCKCCPDKIARKQLLEKMLTEDEGENDELEEEKQLESNIEEVPVETASKKSKQKSSSKPITKDSKSSRMSSKTPPPSATSHPPTSQTDPVSLKDPMSNKIETIKKRSGESKKVCICGDDVDLSDLKADNLECSCGDETNNASNFASSLGNRRILIFDKIPTNWKEQKVILKQALSLLADDGYPLAKFPDCENLPIFKLWFQLRTGQYFSMKDREKYWRWSKSLWRHYDRCYRDNTLPNLPVTRKEANKYTYRHSARVKAMVDAYLSTYYRKLRQNNIDLSREFFPTLFTYEFPTAAFRDCFFSYCPAKEEHCICINL